MRAIIVLCTTLVALFALTASATAGCTEVPAPSMKNKINRVVPGYEAVRVTFSNDRSDATSAAATVNDTKFRFWIDGHVKMLYDRVGFIKQVHQCTLGAGRTAAKELKTFVDVRYRKTPQATDEQVGESFMLLPKKVVAARPSAGITYDSGNELSGTWSRVIVNGKSYAQLTLAPAK